MPCTVDCLSTYSCGVPIEASNGAIFAPYIQLEFPGGRKLTVGNASAPPDNHATISSFQYGVSVGTTGWGAEFEIIDMGGVMYRRILRALNKSVKESDKEVFETSFDFGWIIKDCNGGVNLQTAYSMTGKKLRGIFTTADQTYEGGKVKLKFKLAGVHYREPEVRKSGTIGDEDQKITLKEALRKLFKEHDPKFKDVKFLNKDGGELCFKNSDGGCDGPKGAWPMNQQNPLSVARTWLSSVTTKDERGILLLYDPDKAAIVIQEDKTDAKCCQATFGTYIVNGGNCSPVLAFNPTVTWGKGFIPGAGAAAGGAASGANDDYVKPTKKIEEAGTQTSPAVQQHEWMWRNPTELASGAATGIAAHLEANQDFEGPRGGFEAELKLHGSPQYSDPVSLVGRTIAVIVINPFHIADSDGNCKWITTTNCNSFLSNKKYMILGVNHQISGGSFITTLKLKLAQPNKDIDASMPLGGEGCGTEIFNASPGASKPGNANR